MQSKKSIDYNIKVTYTLKYLPLSDFVNIEHFIDGNQLYLSELKINESKTGFYNTNNKSSVVKIINHKHLTELLEHPEHYISLNDTYKLTYPVHLVRKDFLPEFTLYGNDYNNLGQMLNLKIPSFNEQLSNNLAKDSINPDFEFLQSVPNENHLQVFLDSKGTKHCAPFIFDYCFAQLDNANYDLDAVVDFLSKRDDVAFLIKHDGYRKYSLLECPLQSDEKYMGKIIEDIPHYNADEDRNETINIIYRPKQQDLDKILMWQDNIEDKNQDIFNLATFIIKKVLNCQQFSTQKIVEEDVAPIKRKYKI